MVKPRGRKRSAGIWRYKVTPEWISYSGNHSDTQFFIHSVYKQDGLGKLFPEILASYAKKCNFATKYYKYP